MATTYRAAVIGRTGRGNYGHKIHRAYEGMSNVQIVAIADPDPDGRQQAAKETGAEHLYADYREMLEAEHLDLVNVCPRQPDCHEEMVVAAAESGVKGIICEKPFARTLEEADRMIEACERNGVKLAVNHRRARPDERHTKSLVEQGAIGQLQVMRGYGTQDHRSGAQDLIVLGTHCLDEFLYFAGADVAWAQGHVTQDGREVGLEDVREGDEEVGLLAGNRVSAYYAFKNGVAAHFESLPGRKSRGDSPAPFRVELFGTEGIIVVGESLSRYPHGLWTPWRTDGQWEKIILEKAEKGPDDGFKLSADGGVALVQTIAIELIAAIEEDREVVNVSSGRDGRAALEMIMAVHESHRQGRRVPFPMENRENPYETWRREGGVPSSP